MTKKITPQILSDSDALELIQIVKTDYSDSLMKLADLLKKFVDNYDIYVENMGNFKLLEDEKDKKELSNIKETLATLLMSGSSFDNVSKSLSSGRCWSCYKFLEKMEKEHKALLEGVEINIKNITLCLGAIKQFQDNHLSIPYDFSEVADRFFSFSAKKLQRSDIGVVLYDFSNEVFHAWDAYTVCIKNFNAVIFDVKVKTIKTAALMVNHEVRARGLIKDEAWLAKEALIRTITGDNKIAADLKKLKEQTVAIGLAESCVEDSIFEEYEIFNYRRDTARRLDAVHPAVKRVQYLSQGVSLSSHLTTGFCLGDIRHWALKPFNAVTMGAQTLTTYQALNGAEFDSHRYAFQRNQASFTQANREGSAVIYKVKNVHLKPQLVDENDLAVPAEPHLFTMVNAETEKKEEAEADNQHKGPKPKKSNKSQKADYKQALVKAKRVKKYNSKALDKNVSHIIRHVLEQAKLNYYQCTISIALKNDINGHDIGFKVFFEQSSYKILFRDVNAGEFYTEDLNALNHFLNMHFRLFDYHKLYTSYVLSVIRPKQWVPQKDGRMQFSDYFKALLPLDEERKEQEETKTQAENKAITLLFKTYRTSFSESERRDDKIRKKMQALTPLMETADNGAQAQVELIECYHKLSFKTLEDRYSAVYALMACDFVAGDQQKMFSSYTSALDIAQEMERFNPDFYPLTMICNLLIGKLLLTDCSVKRVKQEGGNKFFDYLSSFYNKAVVIDTKEFPVQDQNIHKQFKTSVQAIKSEMDKLFPPQGGNLAIVAREADKLERLLQDNISCFFTQPICDLHQAVFSAVQSLGETADQDESQSEDLSQTSFLQMRS